MAVAIVQTVSASAFLATNQGIAQEASQPMAAVEKERFREHIYRCILKQNNFPYCVLLNVLVHRAGQPGHWFLQNVFLVNSGRFCDFVAFKSVSKLCQQETHLSIS